MVRCGSAGAEGLLRVRWRGAKAGLFLVSTVAVVADDGFELSFDEPVAADSIGTVKVDSYTYHQEYGSPKLEQRDEPLQTVLDDVGRRLRLRLPKLGKRRVYVMDLTGIVSRTGRSLLGGRVYYTLEATR